MGQRLFFSFLGSPPTPNKALNHCQFHDNSFYRFNEIVISTGTVSHCILPDTFDEYLIYLFP